MHLQYNLCILHKYSILQNSLEDIIEKKIPRYMYNYSQFKRQNPLKEYYYIFNLNPLIKTTN